jgi:hypothetical protein
MESNYCDGKRNLTSHRWFTEIGNDKYKPKDTITKTITSIIYIWKLKIIAPTIAELKIDNCFS